jgi:hypothetical protein
MRFNCPLTFVALLAIASGCGNNLHDTYNSGPVGHHLYTDAVADNQQRLAGEDHRVKSLALHPLTAIGVGFNAAFIHPLGQLFDAISHDTPGIAVRKALDPTSPDVQRQGILHLCDFDHFRRGSALTLYAHEADVAKDYTVRAAALRALNRCRAKGYTALFLHNLQDDQVLVRLEAADALGNIPDPQAIRPLIDHAQSDVSPDVRIACTEALRNFPTSDVVLALVDLLDNRDFSVAWQARQSLELLTGVDYRYDPRAWRGYLTTVKMPG